MTDWGDGLSIAPHLRRPEKLHIATEHVNNFETADV